MPVTINGFNLRYDLKGKIYIKNDFKFSEYTTYGCGGMARTAYFPESIPSAKRAYDFVSQGKFVILGNGSNVLVSDKFYNGAVISTKNFKGIFAVNNETLCCLSGTKISELLNYCMQNGLGGLEFLYGIPATVGGAAFMNAGIRGRYIENSIVKVRLYNGKAFDLSNKECDFSYKHSIMRDINALILAVYLKIKPDCDKHQIIKNILNFKNLRKNFPKGKSCGCVFKNINDVSVGKIIQDCDLANYSVGLARVSDKHCNFILNEGATASEVKKLIEIIKKIVYEKTSCKLEEEVIYIGDFDDSYG